MPKKYIYKGKGKYQTYDPNKVENAVNDVSSGALSIRKAAGKYGIPKSTISDLKAKKYSNPGQMGRPPALPADVEESIVSTVKEASRQGMGISRRQLLVRVGSLCKKMQATPFKNKVPSKDWWDGLRKRHPELTIRKPEKLASTRARMLNPEVIKKYMNDLGKILEEKNLKGKPHLIWNCDETGKQFEHQPVKVIAEKGVRNVVGRTTANRTNVTIMACGNAAGVKMSPLMIVKGKTSKSLHGFNIEAAPRGTKWDCQEKGWMTDVIGERWFRDIFLAECGPERPQMLVLDGHSSHETLALLEMAVRENICILSLPPHTTHLLQPLDRSVFGPLNAAYNAACSEYLNENPLNAVNKHTFPGLLTKAWEQGLSVSNIVSGFKACGIHPYNPLALNEDAFAPSIPTDVPMLTATATSDTDSVLVPTTGSPSSARDIPHDSLDPLLN